MASVAKVLGVTWLACTAPLVSGSLARVLVTRMGVSDQARTVADSLDALKEATLTGSTVLVHQALGKSDLTFLIDAVRKKTSNLTVFRHQEWRHVFWSHGTGKQRGVGNPDNIVLLGIVDFMYMRQLLCKVHVFVIYIWFESFDIRVPKSMGI
ncbi:uncharacterized protein LOC123498715 [Portunus trituberculatus]|uniref:uncharacterized protein LOC123498715 n=1 Tax=Portunus trituberculatus TaxID=210409 RepID=UPI001E1CFB9B|nr:uncharacterized protein LOC123498715 [Portunus trituberculatus]